MFLCWIIAIGSEGTHRRIPYAASSKRTPDYPYSYYYSYYSISIASKMQPLCALYHDDSSIEARFLGDAPFSSWMLPLANQNLALRQIQTS